MFQCKNLKTCFIGKYICVISEARDLLLHDSFLFWPWQNLFTMTNQKVVSCHGRTPCGDITVPPQTLLGLVLVVKMVTELKYCPFLFSQNGGNWSPFSLLIIQWRACFWCLYIVLDIAWKFKLDISKNLIFYISSDWD